MSVLLLDVKAQTEQGKGIHLDEKKRSSHFQFCKIHFKHILVATKGLCQKKSITGKKKMTRMKFLLFVNRKIKVELRNTKALLTIQSCFPLFTLWISVLEKKRKSVKEKSAVSSGDLRGFVSCTAVIWLALTTMIHQRPESVSTPQIDSESSNGRRDCVCLYVLDCYVKHLLPGKCEYIIFLLLICEQKESRTFAAGVVFV